MAKLKEKYLNSIPIDIEYEDEFDITEDDITEEEYERLHEKGLRGA